MTTQVQNAAQPYREGIEMVPFVSVIIPTRNRPDLLREAIDSVRAQTFTNYEIIVVINGADNPLMPRTLEVANGAGCIVLRIQQAGIAIALNAGIEAARGEWIALLDDDDLWAPSKLETQLKTAEAAAADVVFCDYCIFDKTSCVPNPRLRPPRLQPISEAMLMRDYGRVCSLALLKRAAVLAVGGFDETIVAPDWDLWIRLAPHYRIAWSDAYLARVRQHPRNTSKQISWAAVALSTQWKALKTLPRERVRLRLRILHRMLKTIMKASESHIRRNYLQGVRRLIGRTTAKKPAPPPCPFAASPKLRGRCTALETPSSSAAP
jgi:glycosyltransferase involved in cell wall biosynthesis